MEESSNRGPVTGRQEASYRSQSKEDLDPSEAISAPPWYRDRPITDLEHLRVMQMRVVCRGSARTFSLPSIPRF